MKSVLYPVKQLYHFFIKMRVTFTPSLTSLSYAAAFALDC